MQTAVYFLIAIASTTVGAVTGMGGGVVIKPILDAFGHYPPATINVLSSLTVLSMSIASVFRLMGRIKSMDYRTMLLLAAGALVGGSTGKALLNHVLQATGTGKQIVVVQNVILALLLLPIIYCMHRKDKMPQLNLSGTAPAMVTGLVLGIFSSFLGIGGGPFNVIGIVIVFGVTTKAAAVYSLVIILVSQTASAVSTAFNPGYGVFALAMLPAMIVGAVAGGLLGAKLHTHFSNARTETMFSMVQIAVLGLCILNIVRNLAAG